MAALVAVLMASWMTTRAQEGTILRQESRPTLTVNGRGESSATPDLAVVQLGVTLDDKDAAAAQTQVNEVLQRTLKALRNLKLAENSIKTSGLSLSPVYEQLDRGREPSRPRVVGYRARNIVQVETQDLALVGKILDAAVAVGANEIQGVSFQLKDDRESKRAALQRAVAEARTKAETIAEAMGVRLKGVQEVVEGGVHLIQPRMEIARMRLAAADQSTPVEPGDVRVEANVTVHYLITTGKSDL